MVPADRRKLVLTLVGIGLSLGAGFLLYERFFGARPEPVSAEHLALGRGVYQAQCAACHGADLEGQANWRKRGPDGLLPAPPHDETGHTWHHPDGQLFDITKHGTAALVGGGYQTTMIGFGDVLSDTEIRAVLAYIKSRWPENIRRRQAEINARAADAE